MPSNRSRSGPARASAGLEARFDEWAKDWNAFWESRPRTIGEAVKRCRGMTLDACKVLGATVVTSTTELKALVIRRKQGGLRGFSPWIGRFCAVLWPETLLTSTESKKRVADIGQALATTEAADLWLRQGEEGMAAMEFVAFGRHCQQTWWRRAEPWIERGLRERELSRAGHARAYGTDAERAARKKLLYGAWLECKKAGHKVLDCDRLVADRFGVRPRTVQRARGLK